VINTSFLRKSLIKNLLRKGFIENGVTAWSSGATLGDEPVQRFRSSLFVKGRNSTVSNQWFWYKICIRE
jgi:hypothetical protein